MDSSILIAIISAAATIGGVIITTKANGREISHKLETHQAVIDRGFYGRNRRTYGESSR